MTMPRFLTLLAIPLFLSTGFSAAQGQPDNRQENDAQTEVRNASEWMLEVVTPNEKPEYRKFSDDGFDAEASVDSCIPAMKVGTRTTAPLVRPLNSHIASHPVVCACTPQCISLLTPAPVAQRRPCRWETLSSHGISRWRFLGSGQFGLKSVELRLVSARPPDPTLLPVSNKTSSLIVQNVDEDRNYYNLTVRNVSGVAVEGVIASVVGASGAVDMHRQFPMSGVFLVPGGVREVSISKEDNPSDSQQLLIEAVLFRRWHLRRR